MYNHSTKQSNYWAVLSCGAVYYAVCGASKFESVDKIFSLVILPGILKELLYFAKGKFAFFFFLIFLSEFTDVNTGFVYMSVFSNWIFCVYRDSGCEMCSFQDEIHVNTIPFSVLGWKFDENVVLVSSCWNDFGKSSGWTACTTPRINEVCCRDCVCVWDTQTGREPYFCGWRITPRFSLFAWSASLARARVCFAFGTRICSSHWSLYTLQQSAYSIQKENWTDFCKWAGYYLPERI